MPDRLELLKGPPRVRRAHLDQVVAALWPLRAADAPRVLARARAAQRAARAHPRGRAPRARRCPAGTASWPATRSRCARTAPRAVELLAEPFAERADAARSRRARPRSSTARARAPPTRTSSWPSCASVWTAISSAASPGTGPTATSSRSCATGASCASTALRASSAWRCWRCCSPSARCSRGSARRMPLMLLDDVMSELDGERRELLAGELSSGGQSVIATTDLAHVPGAGDARSRACASRPARSCRRRSPHEMSRARAASACSRPRSCERSRPTLAPATHARARAGGLGARRSARRSPRPRARPPSATASSR